MDPSAGLQLKHGPHTGRLYTWGTFDTWPPSNGTFGSANVMWYSSPLVHRDTTSLSQNGAKPLI